MWQAQYIKKSHKFGIELPKTMEQAYALDVKSQSGIWSLTRSEVSAHRPPICDIKMEDFRQKARLVAGGHMTEALATIM